MPLRFPDPDIDPALNEEARSVVAEASNAVRGWLDGQFDRLAADAEQQVDDAMAEVRALAEDFAEQDATRDAELEEALQRLEALANELTPLDEDQRRVIEQTRLATEAVRKELAERTARWKGVGTAAVDVTHRSLRAVLTGR
jgi:seryl-tRNA synthetase